MLKEDRAITALIVDDSPDALGMLNAALNAQGITVLVALSGQQALNISDQIRPDIVLLDAVMPGMDGFDTCIELKKKFQHLPIVFMTGLSDTQNIVKGLEAGAVDYVVKPINTNEVIARLKVHVHNANNFTSVKAALDCADQSIIAVNSAGYVIWATRRAQAELDRYQYTPATLSSELKTFVENVSGENSEHANQKVSGFGETSASHATLSYLSVLGQEHLIRLQSTSESLDIGTLQRDLPITKREAEVLFWLSKGKSNWDIAIILAIKPRTINKHLEQIFRKLGVENRTAAAGIALDALHTN